MYLYIWKLLFVIRRIWNMNYKRWTRTDPLFSMKYELCYSYVYDSMPGGWYLKRINK